VSLPQGRASHRDESHMEFRSLKWVSLKVSPKMSFRRNLFPLERRVFLGTVSLRGEFLAGRVSFEMSFCIKWFSPFIRLVFRGKSHSIGANFSGEFPFERVFFETSFPWDKIYYRRISLETTSLLRDKSPSRQVSLETSVPRVESPGRRVSW